MPRLVKRSLQRSPLNVVSLFETILSGKQRCLQLRILNISAALNAWGLGQNVVSSVTAEGRSAAVVIPKLTFEEIRRSTIWCMAIEIHWVFGGSKGCKPPAGFRLKRFMHVASAKLTKLGNIFPPDFQWDNGNILYDGLSSFKETPSTDWMIVLQKSRTIVFSRHTVLAVSTKEVCLCEKISIGSPYWARSCRSSFNTTTTPTNSICLECIVKRWSRWSAEFPPVAGFKSSLFFCCGVATLLHSREVKSAASSDFPSTIVFLSSC